MSAPRLQRRLLLCIEVVASINRRGARATLLLVEDVGIRVGGERPDRAPFPAPEGLVLMSFSFVISDS